MCGDGRFAEDFRWTDSERTDDPRDVLQERCVTFLDDGRANPAQRLTARDLAVLVGVEPDEFDFLEVNVDDTTAFDSVVESSYTTEVADGVRSFLQSWVETGGHVVAGQTSKEPVLRLRHKPFGHESYGFWAGSIYPGSGNLEVWFQHLKPHVPFDDESVRNEFRALLNEAEGVDIAEAKIGRRPSIGLGVFGSPNAVEQLSRAFAFLPRIARERLTDMGTAGSS